MNWTYPFLIALLLRIAIAEALPNPFTSYVTNIYLGKSFTIHWTPTTKGTVTISLATSQPLCVKEQIILGTGIDVC